MDDENLDRLFGYPLRLVNESDLTFNDARVKSAKTSLPMIKIASSVIANSFSIDRKLKLNQLESHFINLLELWESK